MHGIALAFPGPIEIVILLLILLGPAAIILLILRGRPNRKQTHAFPVVTREEADGPGTYRVVGVDRASKQDRVLEVSADSRANAQVKAELEGVVVTAVTKNH